MNNNDNTEKLRASATNAIVNLRLAVTQMGLHEAQPAIDQLEKLISSNESKLTKACIPGSKNRYS